MSDEVRQFNGMPWELRVERERGHACGECGRLLKLYHRAISFAMARALIQLYRLEQGEPVKKFFHVRDFYRERGDFAKLKFWGLIHDSPNADGDKKSSGLWALTPFGRAFVELKREVPQYVVLRWGSELKGFAGPLVNVRVCLERGNKFKYAEVMSYQPQQGGLFG